MSIYQIITSIVIPLFFLIAFLYDKKNNQKVLNSVARIQRGAKCYKCKVEIEAEKQPMDTRLNLCTSCGRDKKLQQLTNKISYYKYFLLEFIYSHKIDMYLVIAMIGTLLLIIPFIFFDIKINYISSIFTTIFWLIY